MVIVENMLHELCSTIGVNEVLNLKVNVAKTAITCDICQVGGVSRGYRTYGCEWCRDLIVVGKGGS